MKTARQRIIDHLAARQMASAAEIARALGVTAADARHHLGILQAEGAVLATGQRKGKGRGRPTTLYALVRQVDTHNLDDLAGALMDELLAPLSPEQQQAALRRIAGRLSGDAGKSSQNLSQRLAACVQRLDSMGYRARWEAHATGPHIIFEHCPYALILPEHPELCQLDAHLLASLLETPVIQTARLALDQRGGRHCTFVANPATVNRLSED